jgi:hypothetical protein
MMATPSREAPPRVRHEARRVILGQGPRGLPDEVTMARHRLDEHGVASRPMLSAEFQGFVVEEVRKIGGAIRAMGVTAQ